MWQEILAIDTKLNEHRMMEAKDLRPLYLKRRLQLLQNKGEFLSELSPFLQTEMSEYILKSFKLGLTFFLFF